jgi:hypothetical protein
LTTPIARLANKQKFSPRLAVKAHIAQRCDAGITSPIAKLANDLMQVKTQRRGTREDAIAALHLHAQTSQRCAVEVVMKRMQSADQDGASMPGLNP